MNKVLAVLAALSFSVLAHAGDGSEMFAIQKDAHLNPAVALGYFAMPDMNQNGFNFAMRMKIEMTTMTVAVRCIFQGQTHYVEVSAPMHVTETTFEILGEAQGGDSNCNAQISRTPPTGYHMANGVLTIDQQGAPPLEKLKDL